MVCFRALVQGYLWTGRGTSFLHAARKEVRAGVWLLFRGMEEAEGV